MCYRPSSNGGDYVVCTGFDFVTAARSIEVPSSPPAPGVVRAYVSVDSSLPLCVCLPFMSHMNMMC
jgi:hypothetical protein